jgi:UDP-4-amino-4,6-dideoxy-N-acetyl-beta-L-altrosamine transaminase
MTQPFLPYGKQTITDEDKQAVLDALDSPFLTTGPKVAEFEDAFARYIGASHAISFSNATAALHLACLALGVQSGDTVLTPTMSFAASTNCASYAGAKIEFMDCDPISGLVTLQTFIEAAERAEKVGRPAKVAVIVHINGEAADIVGIAKAAEARGIKLIEDSCHALGTTYTDHEGKVQNVGTCQYSAFSSYSFHPVKTITSGEGGMLTCKDEKLARIVSDLRSHGITRDADVFVDKQLAFDENGDPNPWYYEMQSLGFNYRLTDIACALGLSQLSRMDEIARRRRAMKALYDDFFAKSNLSVTCIPTAEGSDAVRHLYPVLIDYKAHGLSRAAFCNQLKALGIGTQVHYIPTHMLPYYVKTYGKQNFEGAEHYYDKVISLPFYPGLSDDDISRVVDTIRNVLA